MTDTNEIEDTETDEVESEEETETVGPENHTNSPKPVIGPFTENLKVLILAAYASGNRSEIVRLQNVVKRGLEMFQEVRKTEMACYDNYSKVATPDFLKGIERMVKYDPSKPRGRKSDKPAKLEI